MKRFKELLLIAGLSTLSLRCLRALALPARTCVSPVLRGPCHLSQSGLLAGSSGGLLPPFAGLDCYAV